MGSNSTKLKKLVEKGDELHALEVFNRNNDLKNKLNANMIVDKESLDTWMHVAGKNGMNNILRIFIDTNDGNPKKLNKQKQNVLHRICEGSDDLKQLDCLNVVLEWRDKSTNEKIDVNDKDIYDNTPLHYAAVKNLQECVQVLISHGAYVLVENKNKLTPCDLAEKHGQTNLAIYLESKMIFNNNEDKDNELEPEVLLVEETNYGLRIQDLQEKKDKLLLETSEMLQCSLFEAELLLKKHFWSKEELVKSWMDDKDKCYEKCGIKSVNKNEFKKSKMEEKECPICFARFSSDAENSHKNPDCNHEFCKICWNRYLTMKIDEGCIGEIFCPFDGCLFIISNEDIEKLISKDTAKKFLQFDIKAFVESNPSIKWCPHPGCNMAINNPYLKQNQDTVLTNNNTNLLEDEKREYSKSVDCGAGHYFCWDCLQEGHEPTTCQNWNNWYEKIQNMKPEELYNTNEKEELSANYLWLVTNSKKCPNCNAPIQKNEGCNHMKCYKCKLDFCWVCLEPWKKHSSATGGYFQCNRYEVSNKVMKIEKNRIDDAEQTHKNVAELNRFVHYYSRFKNHEHSYNIEEPLLKTAKDKYELLTAQLYKINSFNDNSRLTQSTLNLTAQNEPALIEPSSSTFSVNMDNSIKKEDLFIEDAIKELLKSRRILRSSYVFGYYLDNLMTHKKFIFEFIQTEFEECTENLSQIIARPHLKTPKNKIIKTTKLLKCKRIEFLETISKNLTLPLTPPTSKRRMSTKRWNFLLKDDSQDDEELKSAIAMSIKSLDAKDPWIVDKKGRHTNLIALLNDMPELEGNLETIFIPSKNKGLCKRLNCTNPKAINSLTGLLLNYCSIRCMKDDHESFSNFSTIKNDHQRQQQKQISAGGLSSLILDDDKFNLDLEKAMRLSEQQLLKENMSRYVDTDSDETTFDDENDDIKIAIELSLKSYNAENHPNIDTDTKTKVSKLSSNSKQYTLMPYDPFYLGNKGDLTSLFKNMTNIVADENEKTFASNNDKKLSSFEKKSSALKNSNYIATSLSDEDEIDDNVKKTVIRL